MNISRLKDSGKLQVTGTKGNLGPTPNQIRTIKMFVYNYNVKVSTSNLKTRAQASQTITNLYNAVMNGLVKERTYRPTNSHVTVIDDCYKLVQRPTLDDCVDKVFANMVSEELVKDALRMQKEMELERY